MAETHQEVVKVWIEPGCIVCDACEAEAPEVFEVQEETCIIRPPAQSPDFTKPLTPSIIDAAEGCPVDVIKFDTIEVEGPEPWAGQEEEAAQAAAAPAAGGAKKKAGAEIPQGPPDPEWSKLLNTASTSGSRSAGGPAVAMRPPVHAPAAAVATALPANAPPNAQASTMVGAGYARPRKSVVERIRERGELSRREAVGAVAGISAIAVAAWAMIGFVFATAGGAFQSFLIPKLINEPPSSFRAGKLADYPDFGVYTNFKGSQGVWLVKLPEGRLIAVSTICTHLGCIPNWLIADQKFKCPCHGSGFYMDGVNFEGPAPRPLERFRIALDGENIVVDKSATFRGELGQWDFDDSYIAV